MKIVSGLNYQSAKVPKQKKAVMQQELVKVKPTKNWFR